MMKPLLPCLGAIFAAFTPVQAEQTGPPRRVLAADDSTRRLAIVSPDGSLEWELKIGAIHDAGLLPGGNILLQQGWTKIVEVTPDKKTVWEYDSAVRNGNQGKRVEVHAFQRLDNGWTMIAESGPARIIEVDRDGKIQREIKLKVDHPSTHSDTRLARKIANGNYLVAHESDGAVREYDPAGKIVWDYDVPLFGKERKGGHGPEAFGNAVFSASRLPNGNTLIGGGNGHCVLEVTPKKEIVWKLEQNDLPGITLAWVTRVERLPNGNTLIGNCHAGPDNPQFIEVTKDRRVVWTFKDFKNFGNSMPVQLVLEEKKAGDKASSRHTQASRELTGKDKSWWAFQPIRRPAVPVVHRKSQIVNPIDAFVRAELDAKGLKPNPPATSRELIRRACFDLIGLPPAPEQIEAFEKDKSPDAWASLIQHLLSLPQYGERWGRHWLDSVRFAQSNGYERDGEKPEAWRYRDYVVKAFNEDRPYDRFILEQIAGDELDPVTPDSIVATGFQRLGVWDDEPDDKRMAEFDELDDVLSTTGSAFLGLTIGCARCHDHKFDPIPQADYYRLLSFFRNIRLSEGAKYTLDSPNYVPLAEPGKVNEWRGAHQAKLTPLQDQLAAATSDAEKQRLSRQIEEVKGERPPFEWALAVRERGVNPPPTHVLIRGNAGSPGPEVQPAFLSVLGARAPALAAPAPDATSSGRRRALAEWIASAENPLTARVMANRIWQHHFGRGLVKTTSDFGRAGAPPTHPKLLDWLAAEFIENGGSIKKLHQTIMLSQTYQMSSRVDNAKAAAVDPGNDLLWRQNLRRLEAEVLRDTLLAISGRLNTKMGGRGFFPRLSGEVLAGQSRPGLDWEISSPDELSRRSLYAYVRRTMAVPMLEAFDYSNTTSPLSERPVTTVAPQSLLLLNDEFMQQQAAALAQRLERECAGKLEKILGSNRPHPGPLPQERESGARSPEHSSPSMQSPRSAVPPGLTLDSVRPRFAIAPSAAEASPSPRGEGRGEGGPISHLTPTQIDAFIQRGFQLAVGRDPAKRERQLARDFLQRQRESYVPLRTRLTFRPDVPTSLAVSYMDKLKPEHFLIGPTMNWSYFRGRWSGAYEGIRTVERERGPFALSDVPSFTNGVVEANIVLHTACESAGLLFRAMAKEHEYHGYEIGFEPREQHIVLRRHAGELALLARASVHVPTGRGVALRLEATGARIRVWFGDEPKPVFDVTDPGPGLNGGRVGVRTWGAALSIDDLVIRAEGLAPVAVRDERLEPPERRALQSFCLLLLNLSEVVYVD